MQNEQKSKLRVKLLPAPAGYVGLQHADQNEVMTAAIVAMTFDFSGSDPLNEGQLLTLYIGDDGWIYDTIKRPDGTVRTSDCIYSSMAAWLDYEHGESFESVRFNPMRDHFPKLDGAA